MLYKVTSKSPMDQKTRLLLDKIAESTEKISRDLVNIQLDLVEITELTECTEHIENIKPKAFITVKDDHLFIQANIFPPKISVHPSQQKAYQYATNYQRVRDTWNTVIKNAVLEKDIAPIEDAVALIVYRRKVQRFDPPNFNSKFIIDAMVKNQIIAEDSKDDLVLLLTGAESDNQGTDIYVGNRTEFLPALFDLIRTRNYLAKGYNPW